MLLNEIAQREYFIYTELVMIIQHAFTTRLLVAEAVGAITAVSIHTLFVVTTHLRLVHSCELSHALPKV